MIFRKSLLAALLLTFAIFPTVASSLRGWEVERITHVIPSSPANAGRIEGYGSDFLSRTRSAFSIPKVHAQAGVRTGSPTIESTAMKFFTKFLEVFVVLNWIALSGVEALLDPDFIFGSPDSAGVRPMETVLHGLWLLSRNITNSIFAFILLAGGIYLILNAGGEGMSKIKQMAPKFVLAVILVNFSWFFPRVIIDASHVMSAAIYQLPQLVNTGYICIAGPGDDGVIDTQPGDTSVSKKDDACNFVWRVVLFPPRDQDCVPLTPEKIKKGCPRPVPGDKKSGARIASLLDIHYKPWGDVASKGKYTDDSDPANPKDVPVSGAAVIINGLAVNFAKIPQMGIIDFKDKISTFNAANSDVLTQVQTFLEFFIHIVLHVILSIAVGLALLAFMAVLIVRVGVLWLCIAFMPFIFIGTALGKGLGDLGKEGAPNIWQKFLSYVFYPVLVAIPFSIGFTLASQLYYVKTVVLPTEMQNLLFMAKIQDLHQFIWLVITICIIWFGVFAVLEKDEFAGKIVGGIKGIGTMGMNIAKNAVGYAPFLPVPGGSAFGARDALRGMAHGDPYRLKFRPPDGKGSTTPPPDSERTRQTIEQMSTGQLNELKRIFQEAKGNMQTDPTQALETFAQKLTKLTESLPKEHQLNLEQARSLVQNPEAASKFLDTLKQKGRITDTDKDQFITDLQKHLGKTTGGGRLELKIDSNKPEIVQKNAIEVLLGTTNTSVTEEEMEKAAQDAVDKSRSEKRDVNVTSALQQVLAAVQAGRSGGGGKKGIEEKLKELQKAPIPPPTPTASLTPTPPSSELGGGSMFAQASGTFGTPSQMNENIAPGARQPPDQLPDENSSPNGPRNMIG